jgi:hypothetical protein
MFKKTIISTLLFSLMFTGVSYSADVVIKNRHQYVVKEGDTLWDLSNRFLAKPWYWKDIWKENPNITNPDLIYPNDVISVEKIDGKDYITVNRNSSLNEYQLDETMTTVKVSDSDRVEVLPDSIPLVSKNKIKNYYSNNIITAVGDAGRSGYVLKTSNGALISGQGDEVYVVYDNIKPGQIFDVYSQMKEYKDNDLVLGYEIIKIGEGLVTAVSDKNVGLMKILSTQSGIRAKYKIMEKHKEDSPNLFPSKPIDVVDGSIISVGDNLNNAGIYDVVLINRGYNSNLEVGNILSVKDKDAVVENPAKKDDTLTLPSQSLGLVMLYKVYDNLSYGLIVRAKAPIKKGYQLTNPE